MARIRIKRIRLLDYRLFKPFQSLLRLYMVIS